jgi:hypothetical protein
MNHITQNIRGNIYVPTRNYIHQKHFKYYIYYENLRSCVNDQVVDLIPSFFFKTYIHFKYVNQYKDNL